MSDAKQDGFDGLTARLAEVEGIVTHQERTIQQLNEVLLQHERRLAKAEARLPQIVGRVEVLCESLDRDRPPKDERPPHY